VTLDLSIATIYVSLFGKQANQDFDHILQAKVYIRSQLAQKIRIRKVPELLFMRDEALVDGDAIVEKLGHLPVSES
jgi:ribosome-binding factor A